MINKINKIKVSNNKQTPSSEGTKEVSSSLSGTSKTCQSSIKGKSSADDSKFGHKKYNSFDDMKLNEKVLRGIYAYGWEVPSDIQKSAIGPMLEGRDLVGQAQSGRGKSGAFLIAALNIIDCSSMVPQALLLAPTRELANQTFNVAKDLGVYLTGFAPWALVGGTDVREDIKALRKGVNFISGTPGRTLSHLQRRSLDCSRLQLLVLDEADEMLSRGFKDSMYDIFQFVNEDVQVCVFSATMKDDTVKICDAFMRKDRIQILMKTEEVTLDGIAQYFVDVEHDKYKPEILMELYSYVNMECCVIFCNSRQRVEGLAETLGRNDFTVSTIHGGLSPSERKLKMAEFRSGSSRVLIATDLLARGIDVNNVSLVINYDIPEHRNGGWENYIHRIGRSGRYGKKGAAINFVRASHQDDVFNFNGIKKHYNTQIPELPSDLSTIFK